MPFASELKRKDVANWFKNSQTFGTSLLALAIDEYGTDIMNWEPQTIRLQLQADYNVELSQMNMDKLMAMITALSTNLFYVSVESFTHICNALNNAEADFNSWDPVDSYGAAWAITEVTMSDPPQPREDFVGRFSHEVRRYVGVILADEGIVNPPDVLAIAEVAPTVQKTADVTFADDPVLFGGFYKLSQQKSEAVVAYVRERVRALVKQLQALPLQNRDAKSWDKFIKRVQKGKAFSTAA